MIDSYKDLLSMIDSHENILKSCKDSLTQIQAFLLMQGAPEGYKKATSYLDADCIHGGRKELHPDMIQKLVDEVRRTENMIFLEENILENLYKTKKAILDKLKGLTGIDYQVAYLKEVESYNLIQISSKLEKSYDYIKEISSRIKKKREKGNL